MSEAEKIAAVEAEVAAMAEVLCTERCAQAGEPPCSSVEVCGHCDECFGMAMAVLAHREAALTTAQAETDALKKRITVLEKVIREVGRKAWCNPDSLTCQEIEALVVPLLSENGNG